MFRTLGPRRKRLATFLGHKRPQYSLSLGLASLGLHFILTSPTLQLASPAVPGQGVRIAATSPSHPTLPHPQAPVLPALLAVHPVLYFTLPHGQPPPVPHHHHRLLEVARQQGDRVNAVQDQSHQQARQDQRRPGPVQGHAQGGGEPQRPGERPQGSKRRTAQPARPPPPPPPLQYSNSSLRSSARRR